MIVRYTARIVIQSARTKAVKIRDEERGLLLVKLEKAPFFFLSRNLIHLKFSSAPFKGEH